jgi:hypothetical protein
MNIWMYSSSNNAAARSNVKLKDFTRKARIGKSHVWFRSPWPLCLSHQLSGRGVRRLWKFMGTNTARNFQAGVTQRILLSVLHDAKVESPSWIFVHDLVARCFIRFFMKETLISVVLDRDGVTSCAWTGPWVPKVWSWMNCCHHCAFALLWQGNYDISTELRTLFNAFTSLCHNDSRLAGTRHAFDWLIDLGGLVPGEDIPSWLIRVRVILGTHSEPTNYEKEQVLFGRIDVREWLCSQE